MARWIEAENDEDFDEQLDVETHGHRIELFRVDE